MKGSLAELTLAVELHCLSGIEPCGERLSILSKLHNFFCCYFHQKLVFFFKNVAEIRQVLIAKLVKINDMFKKSRHVGVSVICSMGEEGPDCQTVERFRTISDMI